MKIFIKKTQEILFLVDDIVGFSGEGHIDSGFIEMLLDAHIDPVDDHFPVRHVGYPVDDVQIQRKITEIDKTDHNIIPVNTINEDITNSVDPAAAAIS